MTGGFSKSPWRADLAGSGYAEGNRRVEVLPGVWGEAPGRGVGGGWGGKPGAVGVGMVCDLGMAIGLGAPGTGGLGDVVRVLREWQRDDDLTQLHPGDLGWFWRFGAEQTAAATRTWSRDGEILAVGLLDEPDMLRVGISPEHLRDEEL